MRPADARHRGPHPTDDRLFAPRWIPVLSCAVKELSWLLTRGYPPASTLKLVGDRYALTERQRWAVGCAACTDEHAPDGPLRYYYPATSVADQYLSTASTLSSRLRLPEAVG